MNSREAILVSAPNAAGEAFIKLLQCRGIPFVAIVNNRNEYDRMLELGVSQIVTVNTNEEKTWIVPEIAIGSIYLFEKSLNLCCRYLQICRSWTSDPVYVVTHSMQPRLVYKGLGANYIIHSHGRDLSLLLSKS
ncbi:hypothetical protein [Paenibacillus spongiae]|uniref:RCK N-terminal domain-containing protein n=1 Tax=Paenibacillus spongiae TaxID=2909671 RepID=A0ABY5SB96_9BACL|nr:hypothetical protein [Paenibacillus spongiae]UVI30788.1 hypothetical protein L1F29_02605 [Paenibacillus spongiae]